MTLAPLEHKLFQSEANEVAKRLIGTTLLFGPAELGGVIIETEAYDETDPTSHCWRKPGTNEVPYGASPMFLSGGHAYIYRANPACLNFVCDKKGFGSAVLIRALKPNENTCERTNGPSLICASLKVSQEHNNLPLNEPPFRLLDRPATFEASQIQISTRVGLNKKKLIAKSRVSPEEIDTAMAMKRRWLLATAS